MRRKGLKRILGFSSPEIAMLLFVAAGVLSSAVALLPVAKGSSDYAVLQSTFAKIETSIYAYYQKYGYLPCPASRTAALSSSTFGKATDCTTATAPAGTSEVGTSSNTIRIGTVPTRSLNISDSFMFDPWNNRLTYTVIKSLAANSTNYQAFTSSAAQIINIQDATGHTINPNNSATTLNYVPIVYLSHGRNGNGAYTRVGMQATACNTTQLDGKNCSNNNVFIYAPHNYTKGSGYYDDYLVWLSNSEIMNSVGQSAKSQSGGCNNNSGFLPTNIYGLLLWMDAHDSTTITKDGSNNVSKWTDKSGNGYSFTNGGTTKPIYSATGFNSMPTMQLTNTYGFKGSAISSALSNLTIFFVGQQTSTSLSNYLLDVNGASTRFTLNLNINGGAYWYKQGTYSAALASSYTNNLYASWVFNNGATSSGVLYIGGTQITTDSGFITQDLASNLAIGQKYTGPATTDFQGLLSELLIYNRALTLSEKTAVEQYLKLKWGL